MKLNLMKKTSAIILLISLMTFAHAKILCAPVNRIQALAEKLDTAQKIGNNYIAYTATSVFQSNDLWWFLGVGDIFANSSNDAINIGKSFLSKATEQIDVYAKKVGDEYICNYGPGYIQARGKNLL